MSGEVGVYTESEWFNVYLVLPGGRSIDRLDYYVLVNCRFTIPQKLSNSTLSFPCSHLISTSVPLPSIAFVGWILKPNAGSSSSSSSSMACSFEFSFGAIRAIRAATSSFFFCRRAERDHTSFIAKPIPADRLGRYCHLRSRGCRVEFRQRTTSSIDLYGIAKRYSEGKGIRCFGKVEIPLAISCHLTSVAFPNVPNLKSANHPRPHIAPTPSKRPPPGLPSLHELRNSPILDSLLLQFLHDNTYTTKFSKHARVPLTSFFQGKAFIDHTIYKGDFATRCYHLDLSACAGGVWRTRFSSGGSKEVGGRGVEGRVTDGKIDTERYAIKEVDMNERDGDYLSRPKISREISGSPGLVSRGRIRDLRLLEIIF